jgi:hypothetical protein
LLLRLLHTVARIVFIDFADGQTPVLFAVDFGQRLLGDLPGGAFKHDFTIAQTDDAVGKGLGQGHVVDVDQCRGTPFLHQFHEQPHDLAAGFGVQAGGGLVHQQQIGRLHQRPCDTHPLPLSAGQGIRPVSWYPSSPTRSSSLKAATTSFGGNFRRQARQKETYPRRPESKFSMTVSRSTRLYS